MRRQEGPSRRSRCPLNASLEVFGDSWSLMIVRDLMLRGARTFNEFLDGGEGIATNILTNRLQRLAAEGILIKARSTADHRKYLYRLTEKGIDLAPVLAEMIVWGARYEDTDAPPAVIREMELHPEEFLSQVRKQWKNRRSEPGG